MEAISVVPQDPPSLAQFPVCIQHESWTPQQVQSYQAQALRACRDYAYAHSPFYQRFHRGLMDRPLQELPVLTKAMMMEHFDELVTDRSIRLSEIREYLARADASAPFPGRYRVMTTSGSSGQPGVFLCDAAEFAIMINSYTRFERWYGVTTESRPTVLGSEAPPFPMFIDGQQVPRLQMSASDPVDSLVQRLNEWQPDVLFGYPSITTIMAEEQRQGRLRIAPRVIGCAAETLSSEMRRRIEEAWQMKLFNVYATTEGGIMAAECEQHRGLHLFEDFSIIEVVDQDNRPVAPGEQGARILLTALFRRTQPLIRYELTDQVRIPTGEGCPCGRPFALIESVEGRAVEMLYLRSAADREEQVSAILFEFVFDPLPVSGWQVVQEYDGLHVYLTRATEKVRDDQVRISLQQALTRRGVLVPPIAIHQVANLVRNTRGKAPRLISHVPRSVS